MIVAMRGNRLLRRLDRWWGRLDQAVALAFVLALAACAPREKASDLPHAPASLNPRFYVPHGWTFASLKLKDGTVLRYGVASPPVVPRGDVLIVTDRDEPTEVWFETANDLMDRGYTVWTLEPGKAKGAAALDPANGALQTMVGGVIRPRGKLALVAQGLGATLAIRGLSEAGVNVAGAVLASPALEPARIDVGLSADQAATAAEWSTRIRMGWLPLPGDGQPRLGAPPVGLDPKRAGLGAAWRRSDPGLKPKVTTFGWVWGYDRAIRAAAAPEPVATPIVMAATVSDTRAVAACSRLQHCTLWPVPTSAPHLARDEMRRAWLGKVLALFGSK